MSLTRRESDEPSEAECAEANFKTLHGACGAAFDQLDDAVMNLDFENMADDRKELANKVCGVKSTLETLLAEFDEVLGLV